MAAGTLRYSATRNELAGVDCHQRYHAAFLSADGLLAGTPEHPPLPCPTPPLLWSPTLGHNAQLKNRQPRHMDTAPHEFHTGQNTLQLRYHAAFLCAYGCWLGQREDFQDPLFAVEARKSLGCRKVLLLLPEQTEFLSTRLSSVKMWPCVSKASELACACRCMWGGCRQAQRCWPSGAPPPCRTACRTPSFCAATSITCRSSIQAPRPTQVQSLFVEGCLMRKQLSEPKPVCHHSVAAMQPRNH